MIIDTGKTFAGQNVTYEIVSDGYNIYLNGALWIKQYEPYIPNRDLTYEENAIAQIEDICKPHEEVIIDEEVIE